MQNQTQLVRGAITVFMIAAVSVSMVQQLVNLSTKPSPIAPGSTAQGQAVPEELRGPKIPGIRVLASEKFQAPLKQLLVRNKLSLQIAGYEFAGNDYWMNMVVNWGHVVLIFYFISKHKAETDQSKKRQLMIIGAIAVVAWFYFSPQLKPQKLALEVHGAKVYDRDHLNEGQFMGLVTEYELQIDDQAEEFQQSGSIFNQKAWQNNQSQNSQPKQPLHQEQLQF